MATAIRTPRLALVVPRRTSFTAWNAPVEIEMTGSVDLLSGARALVERLERRWDPASRDSDLHRLAAMAGTMVTVEPETLALVELAARAAWKRPDAPAALHDIVIDSRRDRVGLPADGLLDLRGMVPVLTAALLVRYLGEHGATSVRVRVDGIIRETRAARQAAAA